jgi:hypothetical protein
LTELIKGSSLPKLEGYKIKITDWREITKYWTVHKIMQAETTSNKFINEILEFRVSIDR